MRKIDPKTTPTPDMHQFLLGSVAPRPIAFASTLDEEGNPNLAPFSFFNCFSSNPPILVFSANRRVSNNTTKDTLHNVEATGEVVINVVPYNIVRQAVLASAEFPAHINEFEKAGLTPLPSDLVRPFRVKESPVHMECKVRQILPLGDKGGAGHLIICEMLLMHIDEEVLDENGRINPHKMDLMARMSRAYYSRASGEAVYTIPPAEPSCMGFSQLPESIRHSPILTGNNLGQLAGLSQPPSRESSLSLVDEDEIVRQILQSENSLHELHQYAQKELAKENVELAARIAWLGEYINY
jgi:flavin reductase (DIM6/NTAB) family NADH-FMN oxidoreductase RutF